mmetsp:Transcript_25020/g.54859  ORF Transcript_25020/g.54859 Transcript_25020/m.54859 type:complete len:92 (+) Transcript_25020:1526-1801(+)
MMTCRYPQATTAGTTMEGGVVAVVSPNWLLPSTPSLVSMISTILGAVLGFGPHLRLHRRYCIHSFLTAVFSIHFFGSHYRMMQCDITMKYK